MDDQIKQELKNNIIRELNSEYHIVSKDDWRSYFIRTLATLFLISGVTLLSVLTVIYGGTSTVLRKNIQTMANDAGNAMEKISNLNPDQIDRFRIGKTLIGESNYKINNGVLTVTINTSEGNFSRIPLYLASLSGNNTRFVMVSGIEDPTTKQFVFSLQRRDGIKSFNEEVNGGYNLSPTNWTINWVAIETDQ